jgi:hypothetical protein
MANTTPTAAEPVVAALQVESVPSIAPFRVFFHPMNSIIGGVGDQSGGWSVDAVYDVNCPVGGGEDLNAYIQVLGASTGVVRAHVAIKYSSEPPKAPQVHYDIGTQTNSALTAATEAAGTAYTIANCARIVELMGVVAQTTATIVQPTIGYFRFQSSGFPITPIKLIAEPCSAILATTGQPVLFISRKAVNIPTNPICVVQDYYYLQQAITVASRWTTGVAYVARSG